MFDFTAKYCESCEVCQQKRSNQKKSGSTAMGPLSTGVKGDKFIVTAKDLFPKWVAAKATPVQNAELVAWFWVFDMFLKYFIPHKIPHPRDTPLEMQRGGSVVESEH